MIGLPLGVTAAMIGSVVMAALSRDHGDDAVIARAYDPTRFEIDGIVYGYRRDGVLIDAYRYRRNRYGEGRRIEVEMRTLKTQPRQITYVPAEAKAFMDELDQTDAQLLDRLPEKMQTVYRVLDADGAHLGVVAKIRQSDEEAGDQKRIQWYAVSASGRFWCGFGEAREAAGRWLLTGEALGMPAIAIAA